jgi:flagellin-specific chaperone FliS
MHAADQFCATTETATATPYAPAGAKQASAAERYRNEQLLNLTPVEVIKKLYDLAIFGCRKNDRSLAQKALTELISVLNFDQNDVAVNLFGLYDYCKRKIRSGDVDEARQILEELRAAWVEAFHL